MQLPVCLRPLLSALVAVTLAACSTPSPTAPTAPTVSTAPLPTVVALTIAGLPTSVSYQQSVQLTAMTTLADGAQKQTLDAAWQSSDTTVATVSPTGLLTMVGVGDADVTATFQDLRATGHVAVRYDITGVVHESAPTENVLLPGATVGIHFVGCPTCPHDNQTTTTDDSGRFTLRGFDTGGFALVISKQGYETISYNVAQLPRDQHPDIGLTPELAMVPERYDFMFQRSECRTVGPFSGVGYDCFRDISFAVHHQGAITVQECNTRNLPAETAWVGLYRQGKWVSNHACYPYGTPGWIWPVEPGFVYTVVANGNSVVPFHMVFAHPN